MQAIFSTYVTMSSIHLNTTTLFNLNSLTAIFINTAFVYTYFIPILLILSMELGLFDGLSSNIISKTISLLITFLFSNQINLDMYITLLDFFYLLVLQKKLNKVLNTKHLLIYTRLMVYVKLYLTYPKDHTLYTRLTYIKIYYIILLFQ